jgi:hypothetical protein
VNSSRKAGPSPGPLEVAVRRCLVQPVLGGEPSMSSLLVRQILPSVCQRDSGACRPRLHGWPETAMEPLNGGTSVTDIAAGDCGRTSNAAVSSRERANASRGLDREVRRQRRDCQRRGCLRPWMTPSTTISSDIAWK